MVSTVSWASAAERAAIATASVERCQLSWWPTSATDVCRRSRRSAFTRLSSARLPLSEPDSGKNRWTRISTTYAWSTPLRELALDLPRLVDLHRVTHFEVLVIGQNDTALEALEDLAHVVVEAPQGADLPVVDDRAVTDQAPLRATRDPAVGDH